MGAHHEATQPMLVESDAVATVPPAHLTVLVRRLAAQHAIPLEDVAGTGRGGRVRKQDLQTHLTRIGQGYAEPSRRAEVMTVARATESRRGSHQVHAQLAAAPVQQTSIVEIDVTNAVNLTRGRSIFPYVVTAALEALRGDRLLTSTLVEGRVVEAGGEIHLGIIVSTGEQAAASVIRDADRLSPESLSERVEDLIREGGRGPLPGDRPLVATFTVTDSGTQGVLFETPVLHSPQLAALAIGEVVRRPRVVTTGDMGHEGISIRSIAYLCLTYDYRLVGGGFNAGGFLARVRHKMAEPNHSVPYSSEHL